MIKTRIILVIVLLISLGQIRLFAQTKYDGGNADGYASNSYSGTLLFVDVNKYYGGNADGYASNSYSGTLIFVDVNKYYGGNVDGYASNSYSGTLIFVDINKYYGGHADGYVSTSTAGDLPLPVELVSFVAMAEGRQVNLFWITESEVNNLGFILHRKEKMEQNWKNIASYRTQHYLKGQGNSSCRTEYQFIDKKVLSQHTYLYRLSDVDFIGNETMLKVIEITMPFIPDRMALLPAYPNPFNPSVTIPYHLSDKTKVYITVFDILGRKVRHLVNGLKQEAGVYTIMWDGKDQKGRNISSGTYIINFKTDNYFKSHRVILLR